jgi:hypothetical protein
MKKSPLTPCPRKLAAIISDVNMFEPETSLLSLVDAAASAECVALEDDWFVRAGKAIEICLNHVKERAEILKEIISRSVSDDHDDPISALKERVFGYESFRIARLSLQSVARMNTLLRPILQERGIDEFAQGAIVREWWSSSFWEANDVARIRECTECEQVFWAGRLDQSCCGPRCNHKRHSRRTRDKYRKGYYQGASLTKKEQAEQRLAKKSKSLTNGK